MKMKVLFIVIAIANIAFAQTEKHTLIAGTKYSLIPPDGFEAVTNFSGFQNKQTGASIMLAEIPGPIEKVSEGFAADQLKAKGMTLLSKEIIDFNKAKATYIKLSQPANGITYLKQILVFGDSKKTVLVNGIYPEAVKEIEAEIKKSLLSTSFNAMQTEAPLEAVSFKVNITGSDFKLAKFMGGSLLYSTDGKVPTEKPVLVISPSIAKVATENRKQYSIERLKKLPRGEFNVLKKTNPVQIDNLEGYEIVADGITKDGKKQLVYQVMIFNGESDYYIIVGTATENPENNLVNFREIAKTFQRK